METSDPCKFHLVLIIFYYKKKKISLTELIPVTIQVQVHRT